ncbi:YdeI family protein [Arthrobacter luteolus]|uniref:YdeI/OmpD-associated family protein n=1 Tax=Arthrobacter luteolus TaxID=98672 RepID=UPI00384B4155
MKTELPELLLPDAAAWRAWLEEHHLLSAGVWLVIGKQGGTATALTRQSALDEALCFGWIDGQAARRDEESYLQRYTRRGPRSMWSLRNVGHIGRLEAAGKLHPAGRDAVESAKADGRWDAAYAGPATTEVPQDLLDAIAANESAQSMYEVLSSQNRFAMAYRLGQLKTPAARERNIARFVDMLSRRETFYPQKRFPD